MLRRRRPLGLLALGAGRPRARPSAASAPWSATTGPTGDFHPLLDGYRCDLVEMLIRAGEESHARDVSRSCRRRPRRAGRPGPLRRGPERCRAMLADDDGFEAHFAAALALHDRTDDARSSGRARCSALGERRRRARRVREAREPLASGAGGRSRRSAPTRWAEWARRELRAAGSRARRSHARRRRAR